LTWREIVVLYRLTLPAVNLQAHYNIAQTKPLFTFRKYAAAPHTADRCSLPDQMIYKPPHTR
jgi:hypothetical protein